METRSTEFLPMAKISLIVIWVETVLYGVNCVMYGLCMFILLRGKTATLRWTLIATSTILFLLGTIHVGASLRQLLDAFVYVPVGVPDYSTTYWFDYTTTLRLLKDTVYATLLSVLCFILTWRLYVVFLFDWRVIVLPVILGVVSLGSAYASCAVMAQDGSYGTILFRKVLTAAWPLGFILNLSVTGAIVARLWWMGRTTASLTGTSTNRFASSMYIVVESGAISVAYDIVGLAVLVSRTPALLTPFDVIAQLMVLTPLLIVVQVAQTGGSKSLKTTSRMLDPIRFRMGGALEQGSFQDVELGTSLARSPSFAYGIHA